MSLDTSWTFAPIVVLSLAAYATIYTLRWRRVRLTGGSRAAGRVHLALWYAGILALVAALISPIDVLGEQLASMHMVQHLLIADVAAIALTLALTKQVMRPVTRRIQRIERAAGPFANPWFGAVAYGAAMWFWHIPVIYDAAVRDDTIHALEHISFGAAGLLYWWHLFSPIRARHRLSGMGAVLYMGATKIVVGFLGILLAFSPELLYSVYDRPGRVWGMTALVDQQVAGLIMGLEQTLVMGVALAYLFLRMLSDSDRTLERRERYEGA